MLTAIKRALISVSDKNGVVEFARELASFGVEILSTGSTCQLLREHGMAVREVSEYTGFPAILDGRVKTLHPKIHGGLLARRDRPAHLQTMHAHGIAPIDLLVVNLYPFAQTVARPGCSLETALENIDIGGPAMLRAAAKNYSAVTVVVDHADYIRVLAEMRAHQGAVAAGLRFDLARKAFEHTARYDGAIANYLNTLDPGGQHRLGFPHALSLQLYKRQDLRYGENPHQEAALYTGETTAAGVAHARQLQGKELSFNNIADADAAWECVQAFDQPACVIVKHTNPCGVAVAADLTGAYDRAYATDPTAAFGGVIAFNRPLNAATAKAVVARQFVEVVVAPEIEAAAAAVLAEKANIRILACTAGTAPGVVDKFDYRRVSGGMLVQQRDQVAVQRKDLRVVSQRSPSPAEWDDLLFVWTVVKFVKSNAIVYGKHGRTLGVGAGQMSRVDSARIAALKAADVGLDLHGAVVASDAFFPFRDGLDNAAQAGITAVIQPGGSMRDAEVIAAANEHNIAMVFTGVRHFKH